MELTKILGLRSVWNRLYGTYENLRLKICMELMKILGLRSVWNSLYGTYENLRVKICMEQFVWNLRKS